MPKHKANKPSDTTASDDTQRVETAVSGRISLSDSLSLLSNHQEEQMAKTKAVESEAPSDNAEGTPPTRSDLFEIASIKQEQIDACRRGVMGRIAQAVRETDYFANPGAIAGYLSDLRALDYIVPVPVKEPETEVEGAPA